MTDGYNAELEEEKEFPEDQEGEFLDPIMEPFNPADIYIESHWRSVDSLVRRIEYNEIDMTYCNRNTNLWSPKTQSRFIESILLRLPLPAFYFEESYEGIWYLIDGGQRLTTLNNFVVGKSLRLTDLEFLGNLNGLTFNQLNRNLQRRIMESAVPCYNVRSGTPESVRKSIFRRINTGGFPLNRQELRTASVREYVNSFIKILAENKFFIEMMGDLSKRMKDRELVLRFWAFYKFNYLSEKCPKNMVEFLDLAMKDICLAEDWERDEIKTSFENGIFRCRELLGIKGFQKDVNINVKNPSLYEVWMVSLAGLDNEHYNHLLKKKWLFRENYRELLTDLEFIKSISSSPQKVDHVRTRYAKVKNLIEGVLPNA
ncbi:DUF262 domain-containing protein [Maridesulfovibrio sp.]|uniref:DUF262 domain-containing protein n=1 Tax=unclassified Maridesulfovibrio TaxID=2794999 RepID=UPI003B004775